MIGQKISFLIILSKMGILVEAVYQLSMRRRSGMTQVFGFPGGIGKNGHF